MRHCNPINHLIFKSQSYGHEILFKVIYLQICIFETEASNSALFQNIENKKSCDIKKHFVFFILVDPKAKPYSTLTT